jgi:fucose permease
LRRVGQRRVETGLAFASFVVIGLGGGASGVLLPAQITYYHVDKTVIGLLFFATSTGYLLAAAASGWLIRTLGPRRELVLGTATFTVASVASGLQPPYPVLVVTSVVLGAGVGVIEAGLNAYLAALPRHVVLLNLLHAYYGVGALAGPVLGAAMFATGLSWGAVYLAYAAIGVPLTIGFLLRYPHALPADDEPATGKAFAAALRHPAVLLSALFLTVYVGAEIGLGKWLYSLLTDYRGQGPLLAGWVVSAFWLGFTLGRFVLSALAERYGVGPVELCWGCLVATMVAGLAVWLVPGVVPAIIGLVVLGIALGPIYPLTVAVLPKLTPSHLVPTAIGILVGVSIVGGALFPWLEGVLADAVGLGSLLPFTLLLGVVLLGNWWSLSRRLSPEPVTAAP